MSRKYDTDTVCTSNNQNQPENQIKEFPFFNNRTLSILFYVQKLKSHLIYAEKKQNEEQKQKKCSFFETSSEKLKFRIWKDGKCKIGGECQNPKTKTKARLHVLIIRLLLSKTVT